MKSRTARKINRTVCLFSKGERNYQPYSISQQRKAIAIGTRGCSRDTKDLLQIFSVVEKLPLKYKKYKGFIPAKYVW